MDVEKPIAAAMERLLVDVRRLEWAKELREDTLTEVLNIAELAEYRAGELVMEVESEVTHVCFLITGRMEAIVYDLVGNRKILTHVFARGSVVGLFSLGLPDRSHFQLQAIEQTTAIRLTLSQLLQLTAKHGDFQLAIFSLAANLFKQYVMVSRSLPKPSVVAMIHHTEASRPLMGRLARRLRELDESPCIAGDDDHWKPGADIPFKLAAKDGAAQEREAILRDWASDRRLLIDVRADFPLDEMMKLCRYADLVLWCIRPQDASAAIDLLKRLLEKSVSRWRDKIRIVWLLDTHTRSAPYAPELDGLSKGDFKLTLDDPASQGPNPTHGSLLQHGFERLVHHLRGIQIGLALGGGAARGMTHLGVLKALEQHGIAIDMLAGTSAGALTGTLYAADLDPEHLTHLFKTELQPSWFFRQIPAGGYWYLLYKYRRHQFDSMLRKYLGQTRMEQLGLPILTISADLVEGQPIVRERGDAAASVLESINLPPLALPIIRSGQAIVDGGLLNNIPANVLVAKGCNFVIASSVTAKLEKDFVGIRSEGRSRSRRFISTPQVIMRQNMIQHYNMNSLGVQAADFVIAPDVTSFEMSEFTRADEMAHVGETTTNATVAELRKMLCQLDSKLFGGS